MGANIMETANFVSVCVYDRKTDRPLTVVKENGKVVLPGGTIRPTETPRYAAFRILRNTTGYDPHVCDVLPTGSEKGQHGELLFYGQYDFSRERVYDIFKTRTCKKYSDYGFAKLYDEGIYIETYKGHLHGSQTIANYAYPTVKHALTWT